MPSNARQAFDDQTLAILRCPVTGSKLRVDAEHNCLVSETGGLRYPIKDGIPVLLPESAKLPPGIESLEVFKKRFGKN